MTYEINSANLPAAGTRVESRTGLCGNIVRSGMVLCHAADQWYSYAVVLMDEGHTATCLGLTTSGIGWYVQQPRQAACAPAQAAEAAQDVPAPQAKPARAAKPAIRFLKHAVANGEHKARVHYSLDNHVRHAACVTIYAKDYGHALAQVMGAEHYQNDTDSMTDYFDKGRVTLTPSHPLYAAARAMAEDIQAARRAAGKAW